MPSAGYHYPMRYTKLLATLAILAFALVDAAACAGCAAMMEIPVPPSVTGDNVRMYADANADARFWFSAPNRVSVYNLPGGWPRRNPLPELRKTGTYRIAYEYGVPFIHFDWDAHTSPRTIGNRFLILRNEHFMLLYNSNTEPTFHALHGRGWNVPFPLDSVWASATLTEGHLHFAATPERLGTHINRVWAVEGGVGERLYIDAGSRRLLLSIGYVHYTRPYLFQANARPKRLRISDARDETQYIEVYLEDTPHYQTINVGVDWRWYGGLVIEILEIRLGSRYNHLCINSIMWLGDMSP